MFDEDHFLLVVLKHRYVLNYYVYRAACFVERSPEQNITNHRHIFLSLTVFSPNALFTLQLSLEQLYFQV